MKHTVPLLLALLLAAPATASDEVELDLVREAPPYGFGLGVVVGEPTGITMAVYVSLTRRPAVELVATHLRDVALANVPAAAQPVIERATHPDSDCRYVDTMEMHADVERSLYAIGGQQR